MVDVITRGGVQPHLRARGPSFAVMQRCLEVQAGARPRGALARFFGRSPLHPDARSWFEGALGERAVAHALATLGPEWTVLNAVPIGASDPDIAHVIVGPPGIFTVGTQYHDGRKAFVGGRSLRIGGQHTDDVRTAVYEGARAAKALSSASGCLVHVQPAIVLVGVSSLVRGTKESPVQVMLCTELLDWLHGMPRRLSPDTVDYFAAIADEPATWHVPTVELNRTLPYVERFEQLEAEVAESARRSIRLGIAAIGLAATVFVVAASILLRF